MRDIVQRCTADDAVANAFGDFVVLAKWGSHHTAQRQAIFFCDDYVLSDVHETTGQVTRIRCLQGRIRKTLTGTVRRNKVLEDRKSFLKVGEDWVFNDVLTTRR